MTSNLRFYDQIRGGYVGWNTDTSVRLSVVQSVRDWRVQKVDAIGVLGIDFVRLL